jgi:acyl carrier protein
LEFPADGTEFTLPVKCVIARHCRAGIDPSEIPDQEPLTAWGVDSMRSINLLLDLESAFAITFPDDLITAENFSTAGNIVRTVARVAALPAVADA